MYSSILPLGFNLSSWSKGLEDGEVTHRPNIKTSTQSFNPSSGGTAAFNRVKSTQHLAHGGRRNGGKKKKYAGNFVSASVKDVVTQTKEKQQMLTPAVQNTEDSLNVAATSTQIATKKKPAKTKKATTKKSPPQTSKTTKKSAPKSKTRSTIKRLGKARETQFDSIRRSSNK